MLEPKKNGCHNGPPPVDEVVLREESPLVALERELWPGSAPHVVVARLAKFAPPRVAYPNRAEKDCQYTKSDLGRIDAGCVGCKWRAA